MIGRKRSSKVSHPYTIGKELLAAMDRARALGLAAEMAFWLFLALLPLAAVFGLIVSRLALSNVELLTTLLTAVPQAMRELIVSELAQVRAWNGGTAGVTASVVFIWLASSGVHSVFDALEIETGSSRPWWSKRLLAILSCVALSVGTAILVLLSAGASTFAHYLGLEEVVSMLVAETTLIGKVVRFSISGALAVALVAGLYRMGIPSRTRARMRLWPGAVVAVALQVLSGLAYAFYIAHVSNSGAYLAGLATIGITMTALYLFSLALLVGAEFNQVLGKVQHERARETVQIERSLGTALTPRPVSFRHSRTHNPRKPVVRP